jgi:hypothetical protein
MAGPTEMGWAPGVILRRLYKEAQNNPLGGGRITQVNYL